MSDKTDIVVKNILQRVRCARCNWDKDFDSKNTINDWVAFITDYASAACNMRLTLDQQKEKLEKAAGLIISALCAAEENEGFPPRHYD